MARYVVSLIALGITVIVWMGCGGDKSITIGMCDMQGPPGIRVGPPGIELSIRNQFGQAEATGVVVKVLDAKRTPGGWLQTDSLTLTVNDILAGTYTVELSKPFYRDTTISSLVVLEGPCPGWVQTTNKTVVLQLAAGAPPVRSVAVYGTDFLATPGSQARLVAAVDADPGLSRDVTWRLADTTMARIDQTGLVTSKCSTRGGVDSVTATSVADPGVTGRATFGVGPQASCP
jgi:hypothetical protein